MSKRVPVTLKNTENARKPWYFQHHVISTCTVNAHFLNKHYTVKWDVYVSVLHNLGITQCRDCVMQSWNFHAFLGYHVAMDPKNQLDREYNR